jgi:succinate dehydrogenase / fumarate reductase, iron-sulfur subunit
MSFSLDIYRFDQATDEVPHRDRVECDLPTTMTVLDALENVKAEKDGSITFRRSCRSAICGSCAMNINGTTGLACRTPVASVLRSDNTVAVDPMPNFQPMKDLVVHMDPFWDKYSRLKPYLQPADKDSDHATERRVSPEDMQKLVAVANCVMCATCYALCPVVSVDPAFAGPAAIAYAYRFIEDVRDSKRKERAAQISDDFLWLCAHCYACSYCPKHVDPQDDIIAVKRATIEEGLVDHPGPRHALVIAKTIKHTGMLHETEVIQGTVGRFNIVGLIKVAPFGIRLALAGKIPPMFLKPVPKVNEIAMIFDTLEAPTLA